MEKMPGKGGWTFVVIADLNLKRDRAFGWSMVKGHIDGYELKGYNLMPMANGNMFLPVKAEIRKKIKKEAGDTVHIALYKDNDPLEIPEEFLLCLEDDLGAKTFFLDLREGEQKHYLNWVYSAKRDETRIKRIAEAINKLSRGRKFYDREEF